MTGTREAKQSLIVLKAARSGVEERTQEKEGRRATDNTNNYSDEEEKKGK